MSPATQHSEPVQDRSRRTLERIVVATEQLLETKSFESIGVDEIARRARCSTGSFYARFSGKDALLPFLYERYDNELRPRIEARLAAMGSAPLSPRDCCNRVASEMVDMFAERRHLLRAMALFARSKPDAIDADTRRRREAMHDGLAALLLPLLPRLPPGLARTRARTGLFIIAAAARDKILFADAPHASATPAANATLKLELGRALYGYLTCD
jgi:AcrR family transcriptional regulator